MTQAETRLETPTALHETARRLGMLVDNLGIVFGFRHRSDMRYRIGLIVLDEEKTDEHWVAIETQLRTLGWLTVTTTGADLRIRPASISHLLQDAMAAASAHDARS